MEAFDELEALLNISSNISIQESSNVTTPIPVLVEAASSGGAILFSSVGVYMNLVLARSLFKSTLLATSHRRVIRFLAYVHIFLGVIISLTSLCWVFRFITWPILPAPAFLYLVFREISRASLILCCVERYFYNLNASVREDKVGKLTLFIRCISFAISILTTAIFTIFVAKCSIDALVPHQTFFGSHLFYFSFPFPMIIVLLCLISRIGRKHKLSHGLVAAVRTKKLELERAAIRNCILPLTFMMSICSAVEILAYFFVNNLFTPLSFLIYSCRVILFPVAHVIMQPLLREDCRMNIFIWRKLQRRSSEARVRTIMNKESQESIISNFKMIGILTEDKWAAPLGVNERESSPSKHRLRHKSRSLSHTMADAATAPASQVEAEVVDIDLTDPQVGAAAKKIQSAFRIKKKVANGGQENASTSSATAAQ